MRSRESNNERPSDNLPRVKYRYIGWSDAVAFYIMCSDVLAERSFENDEGEETQAEGTREPKEETKIPESTLEPDLQTFCKLVFDLG